MAIYACDDEDGNQAVISVGNMVNGDTQFYCYESFLNMCQVMLMAARPEILDPTWVQGEQGESASVDANPPASTEPPTTVDGEHELPLENDEAEPGAAADHESADAASS